MRVDSHHHFWNYSTKEYGWIGPDMEVLKRDFVPNDLMPHLQHAGLDAVVSVQARQSIEETNWLLDIAAREEFVRGVVGWLPLQSDEIARSLEACANNPWLKGLRHVVQDEPDPAFILGEAFNRGVSLLKQFDLVYDILIFGRHLANSIQFVDGHPEQAFVLDHIAKPTIRKGLVDEVWQREIRELAKRENVMCKFSGVATEVRDADWDIATIRPYWETVLEAFGTSRLMFGSDWPVCLLKTEYGRWGETVSELARELSDEEQADFWGNNAVLAYKLQ